MHLVKYPELSDKKFSFINRSGNLPSQRKKALSKNILMKKVTGIFITVISTGQNVVLVNPTDLPLCDIDKFPCILNSIDIVFGRNLAEEGFHSCYQGFSFPDGPKSKKVYCERVVDEHGMMITQWQNPGECERKLSKFPFYTRLATLVILYNF